MVDVGGDEGCDSLGEEDVGFEVGEVCVGEGAVEVDCFGHDVGYFEG